MIGYFEDEAVKSYTEYLGLGENGTVMNIRAPRIAIEYYNLKKDARLSDLIISVRADEMHHAEVNHDYANDVQSKSSKKEMNDDLKKEVA